MGREDSVFTIEVEYPVAASEQPRSILASYFTVYRTEQAIELHPGCEDYENRRVICTCINYDQAKEIARLSANIHQLPIRNFVS